MDVDPNIWFIAFIGLISPVVVATTAHILNRKAKKMDWEREDKVAELAAQAARDLMESNRGIAAITATTAQTAKENAAEAMGKLDQIHTLVNSNMTAAMEDALASKLSHLVALEQLLGLREDAGESVSETRRDIEQTREDIARRRAELQDRLRQTKIADTQLKQTKGGGVEAEWKEDVVTPAAEREDDR